MSESARSILKHLYEEGRMTEYQYQKIDRNLKEPKQGEFKCTECHRTFSKFSNVSFNYCPHCGREVERR